MNRALSNVLIGFAVVVIAMLGALYIAPRFVDWNGYRGVFEEEASRLMGRDVRVAGDISLELLPSPVVSVEKIRIGGGSGASGEAFFRAERLRARLSITPLVRGIVEASDLELINPHFHIAMAGAEGVPRPEATESVAGEIAGHFALPAVRVIGGVFSLDGTDRQERVRLEQINGELSTPSIEGPYRFRGTFGDEGQKRELRVGTAKIEADGSVRFKAGLKQLETGSSLNLDGRLVDLWRRPSIEGELAAQIMLAKPTPTPTPGKGEADAPIEIKSTVSAVGDQIKLGALTVAFEQQGRPQILTGEADVSLSRAFQMRTILEAKWLDLDSIVSAGAPDPGAKPLAALLDFATRLNNIMPRRGQHSIDLQVEQASLGREPVSGIRLKAESRGGTTRIQDLRLGLPGGTRADVQGTLAQDGGSATFEGHVVVRGGSLARATAWAGGRGAALDPLFDGPFAVRGRLKAAEGRVEARELVGELAGTIVQGDIGYRWAGRREVSILVEGPQIDLRSVLGNGPEKDGAGNPLLVLIGARALLGVSADDIDASVKLRTGRLLLAGATYQDVVADVTLKGPQIVVSKLQLAGDHGLTLDLDGEIANIETVPRGVLRGTVGAISVGGLDQIARLLSWPAKLMPSDKPALVPLSLAGRAEFGQGRDGAVDLAANGSMGGARVMAKVRLDQGALNWQQAPLDATVQLSGKAPDRLAQALFPALASAGAGDGRGEGGTVTIKASGIIAQGLSTAVHVDAAGTKVSLAGRLGGPAAPDRFEGELEVAARDARRVQPWLGGLTLPVGASDVEGSARMVRTAKLVELDRISARIGTTRVSGQISLSPDGGVTRLGGRLGVTNLTAGTLLEGLTVRRPASAEALIETAGKAVQGRDVAAWTQDAFDFSGIGRVAGAIDVVAGRLELASGFGLAGARFQVVVQPDRVELRDIDGRAAGGRWSGAFKLDKSTGGASLAGVLRATGGRLESLAEGSRLAGLFSGTLTITGAGISPEDLAGRLAGSGAIELSDARANMLAPAAVVAALDQSLKGDAATYPDALRARVKDAAARSGPIALPFKTLAIQLEQGRLAIPEQTLPLPQGAAVLGLALDLPSLRVDAGWRVLAAAPPGLTKAGAALPPVVVSLGGPLGALSRLEHRIDMEAFEREAVVRKMERDVEELERLRKLDEERARVESERRSLAEPAGSAPPVAAAVSAGAAPAPSPAPGDATPPDKPAEAAKARPPTPQAPPPKEKPAFRPLSKDEVQKLFGSGGGG